MALFSDFVKAAGKNLNNQTLAKGAASHRQGHHSWWGRVVQFPGGHGDGDGPVFVYKWNPTKDVLNLTTTSG